jgi:hypothetical protein
MMVLTRQPDLSPGGAAFSANLTVEITVVPESEWASSSFSPLFCAESGRLKKIEHDKTKIKCRIKGRAIRLYFIPLSLRSIQVTPHACFSLKRSKLHETRWVITKINQI